MTCYYSTLPSKNTYTHTKLDIHFQGSLNLNQTIKILKIHDKDWMIVFGIRGKTHSLSEFNKGEHLMNFNINYHFADFDEYDKLFDWNFSATGSKLIPSFSIW